MDLLNLLVILFFFVAILFFGLLLFVTSTVKKINKRYQHLEEVNGIRKESIEIQRKILSEMKEIKKGLDSKS